MVCMKFGPQVMAGAKDPMFNRHPVHIHPAQGLAVLQLKVRLIIGTCILHMMVPVPTLPEIRAPIQGPFPGNSNIMGIAGINQWAEVITGR